MELDLVTLVAMAAFVACCAGVILFIAWSQNQKITALWLWGLADICTAGGLMSLALLAVYRVQIWAVLASSLLALAPGLNWKAARIFDSKPAPLSIAILGAAAVATARVFPGLPDITGSLFLAVAPAYLFAAATSLWLGRRERLMARWPVMILTALHGVVLCLGLYSSLTGTLHQNEAAPVFSLFGIVHFESFVFTLGTAVFILALVKERSEAASHMAARIDPLTGIANRRAFMESAERVIERCWHEGAPVSVMMFDLDRFKSINDTYGHAVGDAVILKFCEAAAAALRPTDIFGRSGGEEFAVVLPGTSIDVAFVRAERIRVSFAENCRLIGTHQVEATVSCGVSASAKAEQTLGALLECSDKALYRAKAEGRNRVRRADQPKPEGALSSVIRVA